MSRFYSGHASGHFDCNCLFFRVYPLNALQEWENTGLLDSNPANKVFTITEMSASPTHPLILNILPFPNQTNLHLGETTAQKNSNGALNGAHVAVWSVLSAR